MVLMLLQKPYFRQICFIVFKNSVYYISFFNIWRMISLYFIVMSVIIDVICRVFKEIKLIM